MNSDPLYITIDVGGTNIRIGSFGSYTDPSLEKMGAFALSHDFEKDFTNVLQLIQKVATRPVTAIGVALPGNLNNEKNKLTSATNLPEWAHKEIQKRLSDSFHCSVFLENDATTSAYGEALYVKHPFDSFMFMIWGTGIGGSLVSIEPLLHVTDLGHEKYFRELEEKCGGKNLLARYGTTLEHMNENDRAHVISDFEKQIIVLSQKLSVKTVVLGGGVASNHKDILEPFFETLKQKNDLTVVVTSLGDSHTFGLYGALALIRIETTK